MACSVQDYEYDDLLMFKLNYFHSYNLDQNFEKVGFSLICDGPNKNKIMGKWDLLIEI
jgi:hypothetical protein